jgi:hypothetical protein
MSMNIVSVEVGVGVDFSFDDDLEEEEIAVVERNFVSCCVDDARNATGVKALDPFKRMNAFVKERLRNISTPRTSY